MKKGSKEFDEVRRQFEADLPKSRAYISGSMEREPKESGYYYCNGEVNKAFEVYLLGYQAAKCLARIGALELNE